MNALFIIFHVLLGVTRQFFCFNAVPENPLTDRPSPKKQIFTHSKLSSALCAPTISLHRGDLSTLSPSLIINPLRVNSKGAATTKPLLTNI